MPSEGRGWQSKDIVTWMILIWGFYRLANPPAPAMGGAGCNYGPMTQTMQAPIWAQMVGSEIAIEGEQ